MGEHKEQVTSGLLKEVKISLFVNEVSVIDQFARLSFQQKVSLLVAIGVLIMAFWYFSPGILKGIYDAGNGSVDSTLVEVELMKGSTVNLYYATWLIFLATLLITI